MSFSASFNEAGAKSTRGEIKRKIFIYIYPYFWMKKELIIGIVVLVFSALAFPFIVSEISYSPEYGSRDLPVKQTFEDTTGESGSNTDGCLAIAQRCRNIVDNCIEISNALDSMLADCGNVCNICIPFPYSCSDCAECQDQIDLSLERLVTCNRDARICYSLMTTCIDPEVEESDVGVVRTGAVRI